MCPRMPVHTGHCTQCTKRFRPQLPLFGTVRPDQKGEMKEQKVLHPSAVLNSEMGGKSRKGQSAKAQPTMNPGESGASHRILLM